MTFTVKAQNCYIEKKEASGYDTAPKLLELEVKACELKHIMDSLGYTDQFKVFSFGFYMQLATYDGYSYPQVFLDMEGQVAEQSPFYLLIGRQSEPGGVFTKIWTRLKLPEEGALACIDDMSPTLRKEIGDKLQYVVDIVHQKNDRSPSYYEMAEGAAMDSLLSFFRKISSCCDPGLVATSCSTCVFSPEEMLENLKGRGFSFDMAFVVEDLEYGSSTINAPGLGSEKKAVVPPNITIAFDKAPSPEFSLQDLVNTAISEQNSNFNNRFGFAPGTSVHYFKYPRDCGWFEEKWSDYLHDPADLVYFVSFVNMDNQYGVLGFHHVSNFSYNAASSPQSKSMLTENLLLKDELEELNEVKEGQSCENLAAAFLGSIGAAYYLAGDKSPFRSPEQMRTAIILYHGANAELDEAKYNFGIYWEKEYLIVWSEYGPSSDCWVACQWRAKLRTTTNICGDLIHTILDACGMVEGLGALCDITNSFIYLTEGKFGEAALSATGAIPILGTGVMAAKWAGRASNVANPAASCLVGGNFTAGPTACRALSFKIAKGSGKIDWGYRSKMAELMKDASPPLNASTHRAHHLIPWAHCVTKQHPIMTRLASKGWHASDPKLNGLAVNKLYHGSHPKYNDYVEKKLDEMLFNNPPDLINQMKLLTDDLKSKIEQAVSAGQSINDFFKNL